jgi:hypothetical protein
VDEAPPVLARQKSAHAADAGVAEVRL